MATSLSWQGASRNEGRDGEQGRAGDALHLLTGAVPRVGKAGVVRLSQRSDPAAGRTAAGAAGAWRSWLGSPGGDEEQET